MPKYFIKDMPIQKNSIKYMPGDEFPYTAEDKSLLPLLKVVKDKKKKSDNGTPPSVPTDSSKSPNNDEEVKA